MNELFLYEYLNNKNLSSVGGGMATQAILSLTDYFLNLFKWSGLKGVEGFQLEEILNTRGAVALWKQGDLVLCMPFVAIKWNTWGYPIQGTPIPVYKNAGTPSPVEVGLTLYNPDFVDAPSDTESIWTPAVFITNNKTKSPTLFFILPLILSWGKLWDRYLLALPYKTIAALIPNSDGANLDRVTKRINLGMASGAPIIAFDYDLTDNIEGFKPLELSKNIDTTELMNGINYTEQTIKMMLNIKSNPKEKNTERNLVGEIKINDAKDNLILLSMLKIRQITIPAFKTVLGMIVSIDFEETEEEENMNIGTNETEEGYDENEI